MAAQPFERCNLFDLALDEVRAHGGAGRIRFRRVLEAAQVSGPCNFVDLAVLPPGASIGRHRHAPDEEEFYLVLSGRGHLWRDGERLEVRPGDFVRNRPGGAHGLENTGTEDLTLFVFELRTTP